MLKASTCSAKKFASSESSAISNSAANDASSNLPTDLNQSCPFQIQSLLNQAGFNDEIDEETIGFIIGPRLNVSSVSDTKSAIVPIVASAMKYSGG
jgi:hypothetical protein